MSGLQNFRFQKSGFKTFGFKMFGFKTFGFKMSIEIEGSIHLVFKFDICTY